MWFAFFSTERSKRAEQSECGLVERITRQRTGARRFIDAFVELAIGRVFHNQHVQQEGSALRAGVQFAVFGKVGPGAAEPDDQAPFLELLFDGLEQAAILIVVREQYVEIVPVRFASAR